MLKLNVYSIFTSLSGETDGFCQGRLCTFIRLAGCNLSCTFCDTQYASKSSSGKEMTIDEVMKEVNAAGCSGAVITGGEPLLQEEGLELLIHQLRVKGHRISIETNGSMILEFLKQDHLTPSSVCREFGRATIVNASPFRLDKRIRWVVDYKMYSSGMKSQMKSEVFNSLREIDVIKFVISDLCDYSMAKEIVCLNKERWNAQIVFSPAIKDQKDYSGWSRQLAEEMIEDVEELNNVVYSLQIHKVLWPNIDVER